MMGFPLSPEQLAQFLITMVNHSQAAAQMADLEQRQRQMNAASLGMTRSPNDQARSGCQLSTSCQASSSEAIDMVKVDGVWMMPEDAHGHDSD